jgi:hypothetical protein
MRQADEHRFTGLRVHAAQSAPEPERAVTPVERRIMGAITACRTAALGGHVEQCDECGATRIAYNSCRNRHCPKCQGLARAQWLAERQAELLSVPYFHVMFTLPAPVGEIAFQNKALSIICTAASCVAARACMIWSQTPALRQRTKRGARSHCQPGAPATCMMKTRQPNVTNCKMAG